MENEVYTKDEYEKKCTLEDVTLSIQYYRLQRPIELLNIQIKDLNKIKESSSEKSYYEYKIKEVMYKRDLWAMRVNKFKDEQKNHNFNMAFDGSIIIKINDLFKDDKYQSDRLVYAIQFLSDESYEYISKKDDKKVYLQVMRELSSFLFDGNELKLIEIFENYLKFCKSLSKDGFSKIQKGIVIGVCVCSALVASMLPTIIGKKASAPAITHRLKTIGGSMIGGISYSSLLGIGTAMASAGGTVGIIKIYNYYNSRNVIRNLTTEEFKKLLALNIVSIVEAQKIIPKDELKVFLDEKIQFIGIVKNDLDYFIHVEKEKSESNTKKLEMLHRWDSIMNKEC